MRKVSENEKDIHRYDDMLNRHYVPSGTHRHMSMSQRAAQFAPFSALSEYEKAIEESSYVTEQEQELSEQAKQEINAILQDLLLIIDTNPIVEITYYIQDTYKIGGSFQHKKGTLLRIDPLQKIVIFTDRTILSFKSIHEIKKCSA